jgi:hypothetical protein
MEGRRVKSIRLHQEQPETEEAGKGAGRER